MTPVNKLFVEIRGKGKPVVLLHGGASSHRYWYPLAKYLSSYKLIIPDLLGLGDSPKPRGIVYSADDHAEALHNSLDVRRPFVLVGHSMGSLVAIAYAQKYPGDVSRLILTSPLIYKDATEAKRYVVKAVQVPDMIVWGPFAAVICNTVCRVKPLYLWFARLITPRRIPDWMIEDSSKHDWYSYSRTMKNLVFKPTAIADLKLIACPIEIIWGEDDKSVLERNLEVVNQNENVTLIQFRHGHDIPVFQAKKLAGIIEN